MRANRLVRRLSFWLGGLLLSAALVNSPAEGQQPLPGNQLPNPRLFTVVPCGGKLGSTVEMVFTGTDIEEPETLIFSCPGMKAEAISTSTPVAPEPPDQKKKKRGKMPAGKPVASKWKVTIPANAPLGNHDVRIVNKWGVSNPRTFVIGDQIEVMEKEPNDDVPQAQRVEINTTVTGSLASATDVDYYAFTGKKGQRIVISCLTSTIDSRMMPGIELFDTSGHRLAENRNYADNDALMDCTLPEAGDYFVRVFEFAHVSGNAEYYYRLSITIAPWIDAVYPPVVDPTKPTKVTIFGRNLPGGKPEPTAQVDGRTLETLSVTIEPPKDPAALMRLNFTGRIAPRQSALDGFEYRIKNDSGWSNPYLLTFARAPVVLDNEKNDTAETAQPLTLPCEVVGRIEKRRDRDFYSFTAKKGDVFGIEVISDRLGAPTDMVFALRDEKQDLGEFDDNIETLSMNKFFTRSSDPPRLHFEAKADGKYTLLVFSRDGNVSAGPRHLYRVVIAPEKPDFRLVIMPPANKRPDSGQLLKEGHLYFTALLWRLDGFAGPVTVTAEGLPPGIVCPPQTIGFGQRQASIVISATPAAALGVHELRFKGTATIAGKTENREARAASITWPVAQQQQNTPTISRIDRACLLAVRERAPYAISLTIDKNELKPGDKANVTVKLTRLWPDFKAALQVTALDFPLIGNQPGYTINNNQPIALAPGKDEVKVVLDVKANMTPGDYNLVLRGSGQIPYAKDPMAKQKPNTVVVQPSTPLAISIVPKQLATVTLSAPTVSAKVGMQSEVVVKVARLYDYDGEFKVKLVLPPNTKGVSADEVTIPANQNEVKLIIKVAGDAPPVNLANLVVEVTAMYKGKVPTSHQAKMSVNVVKK